MSDADSYYGHDDLFAHLIMGFFLFCTGGAFMRYYLDPDDFVPLIFLVLWTAFWGRLWLKDQKKTL